MSPKAQTALCAALCVFSLICLGESAFNYQLIRAAETAKPAEEFDSGSYRRGIQENYWLCIKDSYDRGILDSYQRGLQDGLDLGFENCGQMLKQAQEEMKKYPESKDVTVSELFALLETLNDNIRAGLKERAETEPKLSSGKIKL